MRHKNIIIALAITLLGLFVVKAILTHRENTTYPLVVDYDTAYAHKDDNSLTKVNFAVKDRINNSCDNPLFFCDPKVRLGMSREDFDAAKIDENAIYLDNQFVPCNTIYKFDDDNRLCAVYVRIANGIFNAAPEVVLSYLDDRRVDVLSEFEMSKHIWYYPDYYIHLDKSFFTSEKKTYITVCNYSANKSHNYYELFFLGGGYDYIFDDAKKQQSNSSTRSYKYGDSDVYQGSSKQAEDLRAIDDYFGF